MNTRKETALYQVYFFNDAIPRSIMGMYTEEAASLRTSLSVVMLGVRQNSAQTNDEQMNREA
jgi:hypothetical protein